MILLVWTRWIRIRSGANNNIYRRKYRVQPSRHYRLRCPSLPRYRNPSHIPIYSSKQQSSLNRILLNIQNPHIQPNQDDIKILLHQIHHQKNLQIQIQRNAETEKTQTNAHLSNNSSEREELPTVRVAIGIIRLLLNRSSVSRLDHGRSAHAEERGRTAASSSSTTFGVQG